MELKQIELEIRKAKPTDNLAEITELLYKTDSYIYPYWFGSLEKAREEFPKLILQENFFYNINNLTVSINKETNQIIGVICSLDKETNLEYDYDTLEKYNERYQFTIQNYVKALIKEIKEVKYVYISNVCVHEAYRGQNIGQRMLRQVIDDYKKKNYKKIALDVLKDNPRAIKLYQNLGFIQSSEVFKGFNDPDKEKPDVISMNQSL